MHIAVVGTGISGLSAAWLLAARHDVRVFERAERLGGHTDTVHVPRPPTPAALGRTGRASPRQTGRPSVAIDTGFIVYNEPTYPLLTRLFDELDVATQPSDMSFSLRCDRCDLEYAGSAGGVFAQPRRLADPRHLRMLGDVARFNRLGRRMLDDPAADGLLLGTFLRESGLGHGFRHHYLLPMAAAIWSSGTRVMERFPLRPLLRFFDNHGLLRVTGHHPWRTVVGGSAAYIPALTATYAGRIHRGDAVAVVERDTAGVTLRLSSGRRHRFDAVVIAAHADEALAMLADPTPLEKELLGEWDYANNDAWLHTDDRLMPRSRRAWASWNYRLEDCRSPSPRASVNYHMNRLQRLDEPRPYIVSLNPPTPPRREHRLRRTTYAHPTYTPASVATQHRLDELSGRRRTFYAGAYHRNGFHEDGLWSAVRAAAHLGVRWPT